MKKYIATRLQKDFPDGEAELFARYCIVLAALVLLAIAIRFVLFLYGVEL